MNNITFPKSQWPSVAIGAVVGIVVSVFIYWVFLALASPALMSEEQANAQKQASDDKPLYWVAPMDPNFKRDKPGKSPMGMDLVPVYKSEGNQDSAGTVKVDPTTVQNLGVKTARVSLLSPSIDIRAFGRVQYAQDLMVHIHARVEGWVETLYVRSAGEYIEKGAPVYELYSPALVNAQEELLIALKQSNASLIKAAQSRLEALNVPLAFINKLKQSKEVQRTVTFTSPQSGFVNNLQIQEGFFVTPSNTMLSVASIEQVWVIASVFAQQADFIKVGQLATITSEFLPNTSVSSQVDYIYPSLHSKTLTLQVRFLLDNPRLALKPDMFVDVLIQANTPLDSSQNVTDEQAISVIAVPTQAVIRTGIQDRVVLALGEGKFKSIEVGVGRKLGDYYEIVSGLQEGDLVVTSAQFLLDSESSITSDFNRMVSVAVAEDMTMGNQMSSQMANHGDNTSARTSATVNEVMLSDGMVNLTHGPLDAFNMMGMTMNFMVSETLDIAEFEEGQEVQVEIVKLPSGMYQIKTVHFVEKEADQMKGKVSNDSPLSGEHREHDGDVHQ